MRSSAFPRCILRPVILPRTVLLSVFVVNHIKSNRRSTRQRVKWSLKLSDLIKAEESNHRFEDGNLNNSRENSCTSVQNFRLSQKTRENSRWNATIETTKMRIVNPNSYSYIIESQVGSTHKESLFFLICLWAVSFVNIRIMTTILSQNSKQYCDSAVIKTTKYEYIHLNKVLK